MIDRVVGNYKILEKLGEGGMGAVFKGVDVMVEREVAIKVLKPEIASQPEIVERFRSEAVTLAKLNHPGIATLFSFFRQASEFFMVMEFVPGRTLEALLREFGPLPPAQAVPIFAKILAGIQHAHELGILHRDIKPANVMLTTTGAVKVTDFGIARIVGAARMTRQGNIVGTLEYIAPERIKGGEHDARSDIYSLGVMLYEMLSGHLPFERENEYALMQAHLMEPPPPLARFGREVPAEIEAVVMRALAKRLEDRFATAGEFSAALTAAQTRLSAAPVRPGVKETRLAAAPAGPKPTRLAEAPSPWANYGITPPAGTTAPATAARPGGKRPAGLIWAIGAAAVVAMAALGVWFAFSSHGPAPGHKPPSAARPADPGIPAQGGLPKGLQGTQTPEIIRNTIPIPEPARPKSPQAKSAEKEQKASPPALSDEERRKAALRALEQGSPHAADLDAEAKERERRRLEALKALQK